MRYFKLIEIIDNILKSKSIDFTGLGLIIYRELKNLPLESINENCLLGEILIDVKSISNKLIEISTKDNICHDGFHLVNESFDLTDLSYYFSTPISNVLKPSHMKGSRYRTAFYGSLLNDVLCTVSISSRFDVFIFINGKEFTLDEYRLL
ncbi:hypothetical protein [Halpernia sp.]|uniref:hypothetical protein n=1 Tax=Halpernia sp. TaxID=2782209 RepID=UPI003A8D7A12